jgi:type I restriction enzyme S subunit
MIAEIAKWKNVSLGDLFEIKHGYAFKGEFFGTKGTHVVLTPGNFFDEGGFKQKGEKEKWYSGEIPADYILQKGDLLVAMTEQAEGLLGSAAMVPKSDLYLHNQRLGLVQNMRGIDSRFLYYTFNSETVRQQIRSTCSGVKVRHTSPSRIYEVKVPIPDLPTQRKIAGILSAYDDLIENNLRRIKILEQMAQSLYREWFVHFRFPGHESATFKNSELGRIPDGWEVKKLETLYKTSSGGTPSRKVTEYYDNGTIDWVKTGELRDCFILSSDEKITAEALKKSSAKLFPANTVLIALYGATIGQLGILSGDAATNQACCAILEINKPFGRAFAYLTLLLRREDIIGMRLGAAQQNISQAVLRDFEVFCPSSSLLELFNERVEPIFDLLLNLQQRNQKLRRTRDLLLPRLIGED